MHSTTDSGADSDVPANSSPSTLAVLVMSMLGIGVAGYLTFTHYNHDALVCTVGDCGTVQSSEYATIGRVPIALLGLGMYLTVAATAVIRLMNRRPMSFDSLTVVSWGIAFAGVLYAAYLTYVEIWVIDAICQWCVASAIITLLILAIESSLLARMYVSESV